VELLFLSVKRAVYSCELRFSDNAKDVLAGYALQGIGSVVHLTFKWPFQKDNSEPLKKLLSAIIVMKALQDHP
jgi:hypothetical protein